MDSNENLVHVSAKLPSYSGIKWCRHAYETRTRSRTSVSFSEFVRFVKEESDLANDPVFSPDALRRERRNYSETRARENKPRWRNKDRGADSFATSTSQEHTARQLSPKRTVTKCPLCHRDHALEGCHDFKKKRLEDRIEFIKAKGLCFGCLKSGHLSISCQSRLSCDECDKLHPTLLHSTGPIRRRSKANTANRPAEVPSPINFPNGSSASNRESANANASVCTSAFSSNGEFITSMVVPVVLHHKDNPSVEMKTYALLDNGSDSTFIKSSTLRKLDVDGPQMTLKLNTMYGQSEIVVKKIEGLIVQHVTKTTAPVALPKAYSRDFIPLKRNQIPTREIASKWPHLRQIKDQLLPLQEDMEVGLLIGCNCPKAIKPRDVILGEEDEPYAVRTSLGWGVLGPSNTHASQEGDALTTCHRVVTYEIGSKRLDSRFAIDARTKEVINPSDVRRMFEIDFSEKDKEDIHLSQEDRRFLEIVRTGVRHCPDGHYEIPLPIRDKQLTLPNNRTMALNRLKPLKRRFQSSEGYRQHYVEFMNKVIESGYAERVPESDGLEDKSKPVWYIPHHGVYHPKKPIKIRVVFDCSAQFEGESLNKHLLQGPDLTNNLSGVLYRFRREPVAIMCDIESMFYQVKVPEEGRDLLRFLWWDKGDTSKEPQEYRMTVHLFGAASSPGCSNFALKTTADDNERSLGSAPAEFLRRDFYVDDGLKSLPSVEEAVDLVNSVKEMCNRGGFNLHKFTSNSKEVIQRIPASDRAEDLKSMDFERETLPTERALGIQWCIETDTFKFIISSKDRPCTRRAILSEVSSIFDPLGFVAPVLLEGKAILQELCRQNVGWDDPVPAELQAR